MWYYILIKVWGFIPKEINVQCKVMNSTFDKYHWHDAHSDEDTHIRGLAKLFCDAASTR